MEHSYVIDRLSQNRNIFRDLLSGVSEDEYVLRPSPGKWCLLEIVCHLHDEEQYDFRARTKHTLDNLKTNPPAIHPDDWVKSKKYMEQDYEEMLNKFLDERKKSVEWLNGLEKPGWKNEYIHPEFGGISAELFLTNWLAHDYLHFRQITALKYNYLKAVTGINLIYAGNGN